MMLGTTNKTTIKTTNETINQHRKEEDTDTNKWKADIRRTLETNEEEGRGKKFNWKQDQP